MNDIETESVYTYVGGADLIWINPKWLCNESDDQPMGGDAFDFAIFTNNPRINGAWCDLNPTNIRPFICETNI